MNTKNISFSSSLFGMAAILVSSPAWSASDTSERSEAARTSIASLVTSTVSTQTSLLVSNAVAGGFIPSSGSGGGSITQSQRSMPDSSVHMSGLNGANALPSNFALSSRGMAAGGGAAEFGVWGQGTYTHLKKSETALEMDGDVQNYVAGADYKWSSTLLTGLALSFEHHDITTKFNAGTLTGNGLSVIPYLGYTINKSWTGDIQLGYSWLDYDTTNTNRTVTGSYDAHRVFAGGNLVGNYAYSNWRYQPKVGLFYVEETQDRYAESNGTIVPESITKLGRLSAGTKLGYLTDAGIPYMKVMGEWDFTKPDASLKTNSQYSHIDDGGAVVGLGYEFNKAGLTGSLEVNNNSVFRQDLDLWTIAVRARYEF
ncbi:autotransporter outer membrane beta-barrel domain-containing protein [Candidatus Magnetaquicoccus inordinatus]|uniref:autotransporter outer membrane beta-barrel domain-containing protein n=1 Tax=Candidatus Magnetaquicoccus inordinatus TaxID=2496818 RepID=UPI00102AE101|nr:autotransporter outer membrane beta-barrel domain-containing protein [Candidatus Magnetaquicoccus inordinatus]